MTYTEQDVERADEAYQRAFDAADRTGPAEGRFQRSHLAGLRAALEAMEREPLESTLEWVDRLIWTRGVGWEALCSFRKADDTEDDGYKWRMYSGTGETADDAIAAALTAAGLPEHVEYLHETDAYRNAVAAAKGDE